MSAFLLAKILAGLAFVLGLIMVFFFKTKKKEDKKYQIYTLLLILFTNICIWVVAAANS
ncbi:hypothetical protein I6G82_16865 [Lysinibacillus macroides]|uniref:hypothetical protein n=1 Tax=Lysinibacillus macroides TaxID=33935 RepID=UPI000ADCABC0|nr:hypothetical protein [Lysinibacillus macroides]QPR66936.1 hypothetical protein I6G82_16865 [Lysinibacillus macroides]